MTKFRKDGPYIALAIDFVYAIVCDNGNDFDSGNVQTPTGSNG
jgi:hypothetical protein